MPYQINTSQLFLTYPQCNVSKEEALEFFISKFNVKHYIVAQETHKNGDLHLHAYLELNEAYRTRDPNFADLGTHHGNYQGCRSSKNVMKYCTKEDNFLSDLDVSQILKARESKKKIVASDLLGKRKTLIQVIEENPEFLFEYKKLKENLALYEEDSKIDDREDLPDTLPNTWSLLLPFDLDNKRCHFWFWSDTPNKGKTTFAQNLVTKFRAVICQGDLTYWPVKRDTECIIFDEFKSGSLKYNILNSICDGTFKFRVFMVGPITLNIGKPLVIVCSNYCIDTVYPNMKDYIHARFDEFKL